MLLAAFGDFDVSDDLCPDALVSTPKPTRKPLKHAVPTNFAALQLTPQWFESVASDNGDAAKHRADFAFFSGDYERAYTQAMALMPTLPKHSLAWKDTTELAVLSLLQAKRFDAALLLSSELADIVPAKAACWKAQAHAGLRDDALVLRFAQEALRDTTWRCVAHAFESLGHPHEAHLVRTFLTSHYGLRLTASALDSATAPTLRVPLSFSGTSGGSPPRNPRLAGQLHPPAGVARRAAGVGGGGHHPPRRHLAPLKHRASSTPSMLAFLQAIFLCAAIESPLSSPEPLRRCSLAVVLYSLFFFLASPFCQPSPCGLLPRGTDSPLADVSCPTVTVL
eukprot:TRINITY_DN5624_c0_g1_i2.p1 TRINITY_DN5624_c0_g1~~TRINITY_DN5624_c0_g1_i2.p1  ORF type:complete len:337 (-),score=2.69 TRINITY_DN5624_c0_g1_i2:264-1274(-)